MTPTPPRDNREAIRAGLEPFVTAFERARQRYSKRYQARELGLKNFDKMPDRWPMEGLQFDMGTFRRASAALEALSGDRVVAVKRNKEWLQGYRCSWRDAVTFLHDLAKQMKDPHAQMCYNNAAFWMGNACKVKLDQMGNEKSPALSLSPAPASAPGGDEGMVEAGGELMERIARAICRENCACIGERACFEVEGSWPNSACGPPNCHSLAKAAINAMTGVK